ncbi:hypothetical protein FRB91_004034 [Serendipita sp. 411]|nr:hypothetical protein FRC15_004530 [Serendipita sp. 397]KAG8813248.1 hypothetical protein FRC18_002598 [Serendipita sp. 400]KAG8842624.1 hypothetical protein FRB91_004034 [Serendipita sp. 411]KAG8844050.1 hypothetical protein FRC20_003634 [Serendipita sp. 405]
MGYPSLGGSFIDLALQFRATQFTAAAVITLWAYDYLLTFLDEIELVWRSRWFSWTKILFCINRYLPILQCFFVGKQLLPTRRIHIESLLEYGGIHPSTLETNTFIYSCHAQMVVTTLSGVLQVLITITVFAMRVYTLSHRHPYFQRFLVVSVIVSHTALVVFAALTMKIYIPDIILIPQTNTCMPLELVPTWYPGLICLSPALVETLIFGATMHHAIRFHRGISSLNDSGSFSILKTLYGHGVQYYALIICLRLAAIIGFYTAPPGIQQLLPTFVFYVASTMTSRFILSLQREVVNLQTQEEILVETSPDITFSNRGRPQATQSPMELHNLGSLANRGPPIFLVVDEPDKLSTAEKASFPPVMNQHRVQSIPGLVSRPLPKEKVKEYP